MTWAAARYGWIFPDELNPSYSLCGRVAALLMWEALAGRHVRVTGWELEGGEGRAKAFVADWPCTKVVQLPPSSWWISEGTAILFLSETHPLSNYQTTTKLFHFMSIIYIQNQKPPIIHHPTTTMDARYFISGGSKNRMTCHLVKPKLSLCLKSFSTGQI